MIHIIREIGFGDVLWTEPIVSHFIEKGYGVNVWTRYPEVFDNYPGNLLTTNKRVRSTYSRIDKIRTKLGLRKMVVDLNSAYEQLPKMHVLDAYAITAEIKNFERRTPRVFLSDQEKERKIKGKYVVLHIEQNILNFRNVYGVNWEEVVNFLKGNGFRVIQLSQTGANLYGDHYPTTGFREIMSLIYHCGLFIGLDSGPSHIAGVFQKPSLLFFGAVNFRYRHLDLTRKIFMQQPCIYAGCYHEIINLNGKGNVCQLVGPDLPAPCSIHTTASVLQAVEKLIGME